MKLSPELYQIVQIVSKLKVFYSNPDNTFEKDFHRCEEYLKTKKLHVQADHHPQTAV